MHTNGKRTLDETLFGNEDVKAALSHGSVLRLDCCRRAYLRGAFLAAGSVSSPEKAYHLEILAPTEEKAEKKKFHYLPLLIVLLYSITGGASSVLQLVSAKNLPASVLYPMITGGTTVLSGLFALIFFKEKPTKNEWIGMGLCFVGTCLFL